MPVRGNAPSSATTLVHRQQRSRQRRARLPSRSSEARDLSAAFMEVVDVFLGKRWLCGSAAAVCRRWARTSFAFASPSTVVRAALPRSAVAFAANDTRTKLPEWLYLPPSDFDFHARDPRMVVCRLRIDADRREWEQAWQQLWYEHLAYIAWWRERTASISAPPPPPPPPPPPLNAATAVTGSLASTPTPHGCDHEEDRGWNSNATRPAVQDYGVEAGNLESRKEKTAAACTSRSGIGKTMEGDRGKPLSEGGHLGWDSGAPPKQQHVVLLPRKDAVQISQLHHPKHQTFQEQVHAMEYDLMEVVRAAEYTREGTLVPSSLSRRHLNPITFIVKAAGSVRFQLWRVDPFADDDNDDGTDTTTAAGRPSSPLPSSSFSPQETLMTPPVDGMQQARRSRRSASLPPAPVTPQDTPLSSEAFPTVSPMLSSGGSSRAGGGGGSAESENCSNGNDDGAVTCLGVIEHKGLTAYHFFSGRRQRWLSPDFRRRVSSSVSSPRHGRLPIRDSHEPVSLMVTGAVDGSIKVWELAQDDLFDWDARSLWARNGYTRSNSSSSSSSSSSTSGRSEGSVHDDVLAERRKQQYHQQRYGRKVRSLRPRHVLRQPSWSPVAALRVTTACEQFVSASGDGSLHLWHLALGTSQHGFDSMGSSSGECVINLWPMRREGLGGCLDHIYCDSSTAELARLADRAGRQATIEKETIHSTRLFPREEVFGAPPPAPPPPPQQQPQQQKRRSQQAVVTAMDEMHDQLIVGTSEGLLRVISLRNGKVMRRLAGHRGTAIVDVQAAGQAVWSLAETGHVKRWRSRLGCTPLCIAHAVLRPPGLPLGLGHDRGGDSTVANAGASKDGLVQSTAATPESNASENAEGELENTDTTAKEPRQPMVDEIRRGRRWEDEKKLEHKQEHGEEEQKMEKKQEWAFLWWSGPNGKQREIGRTEEKEPPNVTSSLKKFKPTKASVRGELNPSRARRLGRAVMQDADLDETKRCSVEEPLATSLRVQELPTIHTKKPKSRVLRSDGATVVVALKDGGGLQAFDAWTGGPVLSFDTPPPRTTAVHIDFDATKIVAVLDDGRAAIWTWHSRSPVLVLTRKHAYHDTGILTFHKLHDSRLGANATGMHDKSPMTFDPLDAVLESSCMRTARMATHAAQKLGSDDSSREEATSTKEDEDEDEMASRKEEAPSQSTPVPRYCRIAIAGAHGAVLLGSDDGVVTSLRFRTAPPRCGTR